MGASGTRDFAKRDAEAHRAQLQMLLLELWLEQIHAAANPRIVPVGRGWVPARVRMRGREDSSRPIRGEKALRLLVSEVRQWSGAAD